MSDHAHPENASIREVQAVEKSLLDAMKAMEERLIAKIETGFALHDREHDEMIRRANERHSRIDSILHEEEAESLRAQGRSGIVRDLLGVLRALNEFRWLLAILIAGAAVLLGDLQLDIR